jgi:hypothetical protein
MSSPNVTVSGGGRFPALVIMRDVPARDARPLIIARYPQEGGGYVYSSNCTDDLRLDPGRYLVYLLPGGAPVSFTVRLFGPAGTVRFTPTVPVAYDLQFPPPIIGVAPGTGPLYMAGSVGRLRSKGLLFNTIWTRTRAAAVTAISSCIEDAGTSPFPHALQYTPATCGTGGNNGVFGNGNFIASIPLHHDFKLYPNRPGAYDIGGYLAGAGIYSGTGMLSFWLSYD